MTSRIQSINWGEIIKTAIGIYTGFKTLSALWAIGSIGKGMKRIAGGLKEIGNGIKDVVKNGVTITKQHKDSIGNTLLKIAASIGVLVGSIYVLAKMDSGHLMKGMGLLTLIATELLIVSTLFSKMNFDGGSVLKVAAAILLLVVPIKLLSTIKTADALKGILAIGLILTELTLFSRMMNEGFDP